MKKVLAIIAMLVLPAAAMAQGIVGDCSDCHTMHNSQNGEAVAKVGAGGTLSTEPIQNLLKFDCIACHANPDAGSALYTLPGGSVVPQVSGSFSGADLAAGNFAYSTANDRKGHNVIDLTPADGSNAGLVTDTASYGAPPGNAHADHHGLEDGVFSVTTAFDAFTCAGARGCHGTRSQLLGGSTADWDGNAATANTFEGTKRTGIAAISGAHHNSTDGAKTSDGYNTHITDGSDPAPHDGATVAAGYRFIPGLKGYGNEAARWQNVDSASHNEYYGDAAGESVGDAAGCSTCHIQDNVLGGEGSRAALGSTLRVPNNSMSGFCATCHGVFHSMGSENGTSGAFLRHPSDWVIPNSGEYAAYTTYDISAPVARPTVTAASATVAPGTDMVMCLSCHEAHATQYDYMLRFNYTYDGTGNMQAGAYADQATAQGEGGCLACHTLKGVAK